MPEQLPSWDLSSSAFSSLGAPEFAREFATVTERIESTSALFDGLNVRRASTLSAPIFDTVVTDWNELNARLDVLFSFLHCLISTNANDEEAKARLSELEGKAIALDAMESRLIAWVGTGDIETLLRESKVAREHEFWIRRAQTLALHQMSEGEENLAAALRPMAQNAWAKLHGQMTSLLTAQVELDGQLQTLPMSAIRALASHPDRGVRERAFEAELEAWPKVALPLAASLNGVKGTSRELNARRGWRDDLEPALLQNSIDRATLEVMQGACVEAFPDFRRYMKAKARALGVVRLAWFDLFAPIGSDQKWSWSAAQNSIETNFRAYSDKMATFARRSFDEHWIDAAPKVGKVGGAYCTEFGAGQSRILMNFNGSFTEVSTLAHELGHGYHNECLQDRSPLQKQIPMTLAETASIFCETLVFEAIVQNASRAEKLFLLDNALSRDLQIVVDIHSRFLFESRVFAQRAERELGKSELCELMLQAQRETYGDELAPIHPYMWALKGHYYGASFYNFPYTFGLLLALGLYARYREDPEAFKARYDEFLSKCGLADAATLAREFGFDTTTPDFWRGSLNVIREQINEFESLV